MKTAPGKEIAALKTVLFRMASTVGAAVDLTERMVDGIHRVPDQRVASARVEMAVALDSARTAWGALCRRLAPPRWIPPADRLPTMLMMALPPLDACAGCPGRVLRAHDGDLDALLLELAGESDLEDLLAELWGAASSLEDLLDGLAGDSPGEGG